MKVPPASKPARLVLVRCKVWCTFSRLLCATMLALAVALVVVGLATGNPWPWSICAILGMHVLGVMLVLRNVAGLDRLESELHEAAEYARDLFEASPDPMVALSPDGMITHVNHAAEHTIRQTRQHLVGTCFSGHFTESEPVSRAVGAALTGQTIRELPLTLIRHDCGVLPIHCCIAPRRDADGAIRGIFAVVRDMTDMCQAHLQLQFQADHDALTALPNRRLFRERVEQAIHQSASDKHPIVVMVIDLDNFKDINDTLGSALSDELLKSIATCLAAGLPPGDTVARIGGDEFGVLMINPAQTRDIQHRADKLRRLVAQPHQLGGREVTIRCSIGISIFPLDPGDADTLLRNADIALYQAKQNGKNTCQYFIPEMNLAIQRRVDLGHHLLGALKRDELALHYQVQVDLDSAAVMGVEVLLRWHNMVLGGVSPVEFIPVAEDTGLILPIGAWVLEQACRQAAQWRADRGADLPIAVNLSARQFRDARLVSMVKDVLASTGLPAHLLELELTESMLMHDVNHALDMMTQLKAIGVSLSMDDFGTGYSSLSRLKRFPLDKLKIDRSFLVDIPHNPNDIAIVRSIIALAHGLGLRTIGEGAETREQMAFLHAHGCEAVQGYYVSPPLPAPELQVFLQRWAKQQKQARLAWQLSQGTA